MKVIRSGWSYRTIRTASVVQTYQQLGATAFYCRC
jgi:hypothetical protein